MLFLSVRNALKCTWKISSLSESVGNPTKKSSSKRPFLSSSGGKSHGLFAVATINTGLTLSCIHVIKEPKIRWLISLMETPPSPVCPPASPFSNSSIHNTQGLIASVILIACRKLLSDSPTYLPYILPKSRRSNGNSITLAMALHDRLLPDPGMPTRATPFGWGIPYSPASRLKHIFLSRIQFLRLFSPPICSRFSPALISSSIWDFRMICFFSDLINGIMLWLMAPLLCNIPFLKAFTTFLSVRPMDASVRLSFNVGFILPDEPMPLPPSDMSLSSWSTILPISSLSGRGKSVMSTYSFNSKGMFSICGEMNTMLLPISARVE